MKFVKSVVFTLSLIGCCAMNAVRFGLNDHEKALTEQLSIGGTYQHYKGDKYRVLGVARHSEDLTLYVHYEALYDAGEYGQFWIRPLEMFLEKIEFDGHKIPRFKLIK